MRKLLHIFALLVLLIGQTIIGPIAAVGAEGIDSVPPADNEFTNETDEDIMEDTDDQLDDSTDNDTEEKDNPQEDTNGSDDSNIDDTTDGENSDSNIDDTTDEENSDSNTDNTTDEENSDSAEEEKDEIEAVDPELDIENKISLLQKATEAVEKVENSLSQEDLVEAQALVDSLEESEEKEALQARLANLFTEKNKVTTITENILTSAAISIEDEFGNKLESAGPNSIISVNYTWGLNNGHKYGAGSTFTFNLPPELEVYELITDEKMLAPNGTDLVGTFSIALDGVVTVTFTDYIENHSNVSGTLEVLSTIKTDLVVTEEKFLTVTPIEGGVSINIPIGYTPGGPTIEKKGVPSKQYDADTIQWTIDFNKTLQTIENAVLSDPIQAGQALQANTIKVYHLITKLDGNVDQGEEVDPANYSVGKTTEGQDFVITFTDKIHTAYRVVYTTDITDYNQNEFINTAVLQSGETKIADANATVTVKREEPIVKSGKYDADSQTIIWTIQYNYSGKTISKKDALLRDVFGNKNNHKLVEDSFKVNHGVIDDKGNKTPGDPVDKSEYTISTDVPNCLPVEVTSNNCLFTLQFEQDINSAYIIEYTTEADDRVLENGEVINRVYIDDTIYAENTQKVQQRVLTKNNHSPDYQAKTVNWEIKFNHDKQKMSNVVLTDEFINKGLALKPETIMIRNENTKKELKQDEDYKIIVRKDGNFIIQFLQEIVDKHYMSYQTTFDYEQRGDKSKEYLPNKVTLEWTNSKGGSEKLEEESHFKPNEYTKNNGFKHGSYNAVTKEITWEIIFNYNLQKMSKASVEDFITENEHLSLNLDSIKVQNVTPRSNGKGIEKERDIPYSLGFYSTEAIEKDGKKGFRVSFNEEITEAYRITYTTSLNDVPYVEKKYNNIANVFNEDTKQTTLTSSVPIPNGGTYTTKSGEQKGKVIDWKVNINLAQSTVSNAKITDTPSDNQAVLEQSFHLYATNVAENGTVTKGDELKLGEDYTLDFNEKPYSFTLAFTKKISEPYILEYQSLILAKVGETVKNDITFAGDDINETVVKSSHEIVVKRTTGSGTGQGEVGQLTVTKTDEADGALLPGAVFTLKDAGSGMTIKTRTTDENGVITFDKLLFGDYLLIEDKAPNGYITNDTPIPVTIDKAIVDEIGNELTVTNKKSPIPTTSINGTKTWVDGNAPNRPKQIEVNLLKNGVVEDTVKVTAENNWTFTFENLEIVDENGKAYVYTVNELFVPGYVSTVDGFHITNTLKPEEPGVPGVPGVPEEPGNPGNPGEPSNPQNPGEPLEPDTPSESTEVVEPNNPNEPGATEPDTPEIITVENERPEGGNVKEDETPEVPTISIQIEEEERPEGSNFKTDVSLTTGEKRTTEKVLPQTGEENLLYMTILGFMLMFIGIVTLVGRRKKV